MRQMVFLAAVVVAGLSACASPSSDPRPDPAASSDSDDEPAADLLVTVDGGDLEGVVDGGEREWRGVPYAAPPVGDLRWRPPEAVVPWSGVRRADQFADPCLQPDSPTTVTGGEDCLYLNVSAPLGGGEGSDLPVMVHLHPGGNVVGAPYRDASGLVAQGVVVVTVAYRLGVLGFVGHPALTDEGGGSSGEYGVLDQIEALRWVRANISAFGGDPANVTLFGSSAGSVDAAALVASPLAEGMIHRAIVQTMYDFALRGPPIEESVLDGFGVSDALGCIDAADELRCLRAEPAEDLVLALDDLGPRDYVPWVGGQVLPDGIPELLDEQDDPVPLMVGSDRHEAANQWFGEHTIGGVSFPPDEWRRRTDAIAGPALGDEVRRRYPPVDYDDQLWATVEVYTDAVYACPGRRFALASDGVVWRYVYDHTFQSEDPRVSARAGHIFEDVLLWGDDPYVRTAAEEDFAQQLAEYWTNFASTGDPNGSGLAEWPRHEPGSERLLTLGLTSQQAERHHHDDCVFWDDTALLP